MARRARIDFGGDFLPPLSLTEDGGGRKKNREILPVDEEIKRSFSRMILHGPSGTSGNHVPFIPHPSVVDPAIVLAALEDPDKLEDFPEDEELSPCSMMEDTGEIRISALHEHSGETPFATQDLDVADEEEIPGLSPEGGFQVFCSCQEMEERDRKFLDADRRHLNRRCCQEGIVLPQN